MEQWSDSSYRAHCPDILNLWEGEHPYSPAYVSFATQKVYQSPEALFCPFWCQQKGPGVKINFQPHSHVERLAKLHINVVK